MRAVHKPNSVSKQSSVLDLDYSKPPAIFQKMAGHLSLLVNLAPDRSLPCRYLSISQVVFYTTVAPEPKESIGLFTFLWHLSDSCLWRMLSVGLPWGVRTFLTLQNNAWLFVCSQVYYLTKLKIFKLFFYFLWKLYILQRKIIFSYFSQIWLLFKQIFFRSIHCSNHFFKFRFRLVFN